METRKKKAMKAYDIWNIEEVKKSNKTHSSTKRMRKTPLPHPGQSYNPDPEDHAKLLHKVAQKELEYQKKEATIRKATTVKVDQRELHLHEKEELEAGIEHLIKSKDSTSAHKDDDSDESSIDSAYNDYDEKDFEAIIKDKTVNEKRKTRQQRLRQLKDRLQRKAAKLKKIKNIRLSKIDSIKKIMKELDKREKELAVRGKKRRKTRIERFGQKFEQSDPIYCLSSELPSKLRETSCSMDALVREQLENFQSRLMVEPTKPQVKTRRYKKKEYERKVAAEHES